MKVVDLSVALSRSVGFRDHLGKVWRQIIAAARDARTYATNATVLHEAGFW